MRTNGTSDSLKFSIKGQNAFQLFGSLGNDHSRKKATLRPDPAQNNSIISVKTTVIEDISPYGDFEEVLYWESGLDKDPDCLGQAEGAGRPREFLRRALLHGPYPGYDEPFRTRSIRFAA